MGVSRRFTWNFLAGAAILGFFGAYALWNARDLLGGSALAVSGPEVIQGGEPVAALSGSVSRATTHLTVNGFPTFTDEAGAWADSYLLRPGRNVFVAEAKDRFGETEKVERVVWYLPEQG